jgi:Fur family ferric uptake transcriptional regulator
MNGMNAFPQHTGEHEMAAMAPLCSVFRRFLKSKSLKYTPERADVLDAVIEREGMFDVDDLLAEMRTRGHRASRATVYRTIRLLQEAGIITQTLFDPKLSHYRLVYGKEPRDYMVCVRTGKVIEFTDEKLVKLREEICKEHGWEPVAHRFQIYAVSPQGAGESEVET